MVLNLLSHLLRKREGQSFCIFQWKCTTFTTTLLQACAINEARVYLTTPHKTLKACKLRVHKWHYCYLCWDFSQRTFARNLSIKLAQRWPFCFLTIANRNILLCGIWNKSHVYSLGSIKLASRCVLLQSYHIFPVLHSGCASWFYSSWQ